MKIAILSRGKNIYSTKRLIEAGENMSAIQKRAGHASPQITSNIYGHVTEELENKTAEYFNQFNPKKD